MGQRVDAITYKADVKSRIGDRLTEMRNALTGKFKGLVSQGSDRRPARTT
jgi:hypothetical protein